MRIAIIAVLTSFAAGIFAAATLRLMILVTNLIWDRPLAQTPLYIFAACVLGGILVGLTRLGSNRVETLRDQIDAAVDPLSQKKSHIALIALSAVIAVGFGGALGPEAGLIAVITELAALVSLVVAHSRAEAEVVGRASISAALAALYASPPGGAVYAADETRAGAWEKTRPDSVPYLGFIAALAGLAGFMIAAHFVFEGSFHRIDLPAHISPGDGTDILYALLPAAVGAAIGAGFLHLRAFASRLFEVRISHPVVQSTLGGVLFGAMVAMWPVLRFSGHHEFESMLHWGAGAAVLALLGLALAKMLATVLCLSSGWRGGAIFPLIFAGGAAGYAAQHLQGGDVSVAVAAGLSGATAAGLGRPVAALLILVFLVGADVLLPVCVGVGFGMVAAKVSPKAAH